MAKKGEATTKKEQIVYNADVQAEHQPRGKILKYQNRVNYLSQLLSCLVFSFMPNGCH